MTQTLRLSLILLFSLAVQTGCNVINPSEEVPMYVRVDSFAFSPAAGFGTSSYRIPSATFYYNNSLLGAHLLPATIPVLGEPGGVLTVTPGIDYSGLGGYQVSYPFYRSDTFQLTGTKGSITTLAPKTTYFTSTQVRYSEDFEGNPLFTIAGGDAAIKKTTAPDSVFEGAGSGRIFLQSPQISSQSINTAGFALEPGRQAYLELNYKSNMTLEVGMLTFLPSGASVPEYFISFRPRSDWRKVYIGLQDFVAKYQGSTYYILLKGTLDNGESSGVILLDNLKVLTF